MGRDGEAGLQDEGEHRPSRVALADEQGVRQYLVVRGHVVLVNSRPEGSLAGAQGL